MNARMEMVATTTFEMIPHNLIKHYDAQPRTYLDMDRVAELAESIAAEGQNTAIIVTKRPRDTHYTLIGGERRWRACGILSEQQGSPFMMKANVEPYVDEITLFSKAFIDNVHHEDMPPLDVAAGFKRLLEEGGKSVEEIAKLYGKSAVFVRNYLTLNDLAPEVKQLMDPSLDTAVKLGVTQAIEIARVSDHSLQALLADEAVAARWTVRDVQIHTSVHVPTTKRSRSKARPKDLFMRTPNDRRRLFQTFRSRTHAWLNREMNEMTFEKLFSNLSDGEEQREDALESIKQIEDKLKTLRQRLAGD